MTDMFRAAILVIATLFLGLRADAAPVSTVGNLVPVHGVAFGGLGAAATLVDLDHGLPVNCILGCSGGGGGNVNIASVGGVAADPLAAQPITAMQLPAALGQTNMAGAVPVTIASDQPAVPVSVSSLPLPAGAATSALQTTGNGSLASILSALGGPLTVQGPNAGATTASGNPLPLGAIYRTTRPTYTDGQRTEAHTDVNGNLSTSICNATGCASIASPGNGTTRTSGTAVQTDSVLRLYNATGTNFEQWRGDANGGWTVQSSSGNAAIGISEISSAVTETGHVVRTVASNLYRAVVTTGAAGGYFMVFDAVAVPADGAVVPRICRAVAATSSVDINYTVPVNYATGISVAFSTSGCFTKTSSSTAYFEVYFR